MSIDTALELPLSSPETEDNQKRCDGAAQKRILFFHTVKITRVIALYFLVLKRQG